MLATKLLAAVSLALPARAIRTPPARATVQLSAGSSSLACCAPGGPLDPLDAPLEVVEITPAVAISVRVPDDDAVMEDYIGQAHTRALASADYDAAMLAHCQRAIADEPAYWAQLWPSALALSRWLLARPELVSGRSVVEIGSGLGLCSLAAAAAGASRVLATDREPRALAFAAQSAVDNGLRLQTSARDWSAPSAWEEGGAQAVLGADVLYGDAAAAELAPLLGRLVPAGGAAILADNADRPYGDAHRRELHRLLAARGFARAAEGVVEVELSTRQGERFTLVVLHYERKHAGG